MRKFDSVLITGGAGFLGSHLVDSFMLSGANVIVNDNLITGRMENIDHWLDSPNFSFYETDIIDAVLVDRKIDAVFNLASPASPFDYAKYSIETLRVGSEGARNALEVAREHDAVFFQASTSEVYGDPQLPTQNESYFGNVNSIGPRSCYDESKRYAEALIMSYYRKYHMETRIIRIFNTYGPRMRQNDGRVIPTFICQALKNEPLTVFGDGGQNRSFCYVDDLVRGIRSLAASEYPLPMNIGNPENYKIIELAQLIIELLVSKSEIIHLEAVVDDPYMRNPDISKAQEILDWNPTVKVRDGLTKTIESFKKEIENSL